MTSEESQLDTAAERERRGLAGHAVLRHWPVLLGVATAVLIALDLSAGVELAKVLAGSAVVYLGAAAVGSRRAAWPMFALTIVVIFAAELIDPDFEATWAVLVLALLSGIGGLIRTSRKDSGHDRGAGGRRPLAVQAGAMVAFAVIAIVALVADTTVGSFLIAFGLLGHAAWDVRHLRARAVVAPSLAEYCMVLDTCLAVVIMVFAVR